MRLLDTFDAYWKNYCTSMTQFSEYFEINKNNDAHGIWGQLRLGYRTVNWSKFRDTAVRAFCTNNFNKEPRPAETGAKWNSIKTSFTCLSPFVLVLVQTSKKCSNDIQRVSIIRLFSLLYFYLANMYCVVIVKTPYYGHKDIFKIYSRKI